MAKKLQLRGGTTSQHGSFTGALREVTVDTDKKVVVVHDGSTAGGFPSASGDLLASNNLSEVTAATAFTTIKQAATATATGVVELATNAETSTGTDTGRAVTPAGLASLIGSDIQAYNSTYVVDADIGSTVQAYDATYVVDADIGSSVQAYDADTLKADTADTLTAGYACTVHDAGTKASGTYTPDEANGNMQKFVNGGAHTLAPPANDCTLVLQQTNNASAGTITTSGFTLVDGDSLTSTNGHDFFLYITNSDSFSSLTVKALQ